MTDYLVVSIISDDKPGIVEQLADNIRQCDGNWLESNLARLGGKFAGIVQVGVPAGKKSALIDALNGLAGRGISVQVEAMGTTTDTEDSGQTWTFNVYGNDRAGIVYEVTQAFAQRGINLEEMSSRCSSMPHVGTPMFEASGRLRIPARLNVADLENQLGKISDELAVDIQLEGPSE